MKTLMALLLAGMLSAAAFVQKQEKPEPAELVLKNGLVYTLNEAQPRAEAVALRYGQIVFVGSSLEAKKYESKGTRVVDLKGKVVVPGLADAHYHFAGVGYREMNLNLEGTTSRSKTFIRNSVRASVAA